MTPAPIKFLLVDDLEANLFALEGLLRREGLELLMARNGAQALELLLVHDVALALVDVQMPDMDGFEMAELMRGAERTRRVPIIFLTAGVNSEQRHFQGYEVGAVDFLYKPIDPHVLRSKAEVFFELACQRRDLQVIAETNARLLEERTRAEAALKAAKDAAESANRAKDQFLATLSHELRNPLNPVLLTATELLADPAVTGDVRAAWEVVHKNIALEARLIDDLLDLTRISRGKMALQVEQVDVHGVLRDALDTVRSTLDEKRLRLHLQLDADRVIANGDPVRLQQVFWNVLSNAVKFTPEHGSVTVKTWDDGESRLVVQIADSGIGMTPGEIARIFDAFSQGEHAEVGGSHRFGGLGLGMGITRQLVEMHGGRIRAESAGRGQGAAFTIELPLLSGVVAAGRGRPAAVGESSPAAGGAQRTIEPLDVLLVEDHETTRTTLVRLLSRRGHHVTPVGTMAEARACVQQQQFDLVVSDLGLPDGDGHALMAELRTLQGEGLQGIAISGYGMPEDISRSMEAGFSVHLTKPVEIAQLEAALRDIHA